MTLNDCNYYYYFGLPLVGFGLLDGLRVGFLEGRLVGERIDGRRVGFLEGRLVGERIDGRRVGRLEGSVGFNVGFKQFGLVASGPQGILEQVVVSRISA